MNSYKNMAAMLLLLVCAGCVEETSFEPYGHHEKLANHLLHWKT